MEHPEDGAVLLPFHPSRLQRAEGRALCHLQGLRGAEPDGAGAYQRAAERVHQDGRSKGTVGNLRGVRRHHVRHREPAGQGTGQRRQDTHQLGKPAHHELKNGKTNENKINKFHKHNKLENETSFTYTVKFDDVD